MLQQSGGSGGGSGGGGDGGFGSDYTAADSAAAEAADADLFAAYYGYQAQMGAESDYFDSAEEVSPEAFFGAGDLYQQEAMLADDSIPAQ